MSAKLEEATGVAVADHILLVGPPFTQVKPVKPAARLVRAWLCRPRLPHPHRGCAHAPNQEHKTVYLFKKDVFRPDCAPFSQPSVPQLPALVTGASRAAETICITA